VQSIEAAQTDPRGRLPWPALLVALTAAFFLGLGEVPLFDVDEGAFAEASREMLAGGDWVSPQLNGEPRYDKPVLAYWLQAGAMSWFGPTAFAARLPSALAACLWMLLLFRFVRSLPQAIDPALASLLLATGIQVQLIARAATADALLNLFLAGSLFAVFRYWREPRTRHLLWAYACAGLGFLAKGPVALLIPAAVSLAFFASTASLGRWWRAALDPRGWLLFALLVLPWYGAQLAREGFAFVEGFFLHHNLERFRTPLHGRSGSLVYYLPVLLLGISPFTTLGITVLARARSLWREPLTRFGLIWFGFVLVFFSLSGTKLSHYLVYGYTGLALCMAACVPQLRGRALHLLPLAGFFAVLAALPWLFARAAGCLAAGRLQSEMAAADAFIPGFSALAIAGLALALALAFWPRLSLVPALATAGLASAVANAMLVLPLLATVWQQPVVEAAARTGAAAPLYMWRINKPSFLFYTQRTVNHDQPRRSGDQVLTRQQQLGFLGKVRIDYARYGIVLATLEADQPADAPERERLRRTGSLAACLLPGHGTR
jgi:4-amino-4-deoxy-L-arabinose transferase-like glycosyltransferase